MSEESDQLRMEGGGWMRGLNFPLYLYILYPDLHFENESENILKKKRKGRKVKWFLS